jgi:hypothetical protein
MTRRKLTALGLLVALAAAALAPTAPAKDDRAKSRDPQVGRSFRIPYRLTLTNHYLVRVRLNGKGPFNFLVDTGAPLVFVGTEAAKAAGLPEPGGHAFWTKLDRLDLEGGATLEGLNVRIDDPFQLVGMNALGLPGASIDGILGFSALARYKMEFDPTDDRMTWTRLDFEPEDPVVPEDPADRRAPAEVQMMSALGPIMKMMSVFVGKQEPDILVPQGLLGLELEEDGGAVRVAKVLAGTPAARAGVEAGDVLVEVRDATVESLEAAHGAIAALRPGDEVVLTLRRGGDTIERTLNASEGF